MAILVTDTAAVLGSDPRPGVPHTRCAHGVGISCIGRTTEEDIARTTGRVAAKHGSSRATPTTASTSTRLCAEHMRLYQEVAAQ